MDLDELGKTIIRIKENIKMKKIFMKNAESKLPAEK